jgi:hypothetical protein
VDADDDGAPDPLGVSAAPVVPALAAHLLANVPNPFNPGTMIRFEVPGTDLTEVELVIFDLRGRRVRTLIDGPIAPGTKEIYWNGRSDAGMRVAAGTYISRLNWNGRAVTRPLSLVK